MQLTSLLLALLLTAAPPEPEEPLFKLSLPTVADHDAWRAPGFRLSLSYGYGGLIGREEVGDAVTHTPALRLGARLDEHWSLLLGFRYGILAGEGSGVQFSGTIEPTYHPFEGLSLSLGAGVGGFIVPGTFNAEPPVPASGVVSSYTFPSSQPRLTECTGQGVVALARVEYLFVVGPLFSTGPAVETGVHWTDCREDVGSTQPETGRPVQLQQFWAHHTWSASWVLSWR